MPSPILSTVNPMAAQMARLLAGSELDELREIVKRWVAEAPVQPTREELEQALTMMLRLAAQQTTGSPPPR